MGATSRNFSENEFKCKCCGQNKMRQETVNRLQQLRDAYGKSITITSGYRCPAHNLAVAKTGGTGPHTTGQAIDIACQGADAYQIMKLALQLGFTGIGVSQKGTGRYLHLDDLTVGFPRPTVWSY